MPEPSCPLPTGAYNLELLHGFEEYLGGYNFGTGSGQLDFLNMKLDWACG